MIRERTSAYYITNRLAGMELSARELQIVRLLCSEDEPSTAQVAEKLELTDNTTKAYIKRVHKKLGVKSRVGMTRWAIKNGHVTI